MYLPIWDIDFDYQSVKCLATAFVSLTTFIFSRQ